MNAISTISSAIAPIMVLTIGRNSVPIVDFADASAKYSAIRNASGLGGSRLPEGKIYQAGEVVARVSYNGRVWKAGEWKAGERPLYDPNGFYGDPQDLYREHTLTPIAGA